jgi:hypothetical protein
MRIWQHHHTQKRLANPTASTVPLVLVDGVQALDQSFTQDATNFYVSYTVHFSTHTISIVFNPTTTPSPTPSPNSTPIPATTSTPVPHSSPAPPLNIPIELAIVAVAVAIVTGMTVYFKIVRKSKPR